MITVLTGSNSHAKREKLAALKAEFKKHHASAGIEAVAGEAIEPAQLNSLLAGATLFATDRLVIIKGISENKPVVDQFLNMYSSVSNETHLVLVEANLDKRTALYKTLKKEAELLEFAELDEIAAANWAKTFVQKEGGTIDANALRKLIRAVGTDQSRLQSEVQKLVLYNKKITQETIELLVDKKPEDTIFQLLEYALSGKTDQALGVLAGLEQAHEDPFQTASMLVWQTNILAIVFSAHSVTDADVAKSAKLNPFVVRKTRDLTRTMTKAKLNTILDAVAECDRLLKSSSANPWHVLERTILSL